MFNFAKCYNVNIAAFYKTLIDERPFGHLVVGLRQLVQHRFNVNRHCQLKRASSVIQIGFNRCYALDCF